MTNNGFITVSAAQFYKDLKTINSAADIFSGLYTIGAENNLSAEENLRVSKEIVSAVQKFNQCNLQVQDDTVKAMNRFFTELRRRNIEDRVLIMDKMRFGIAAFSDEELAAELEAGKNLDEVYKEKNANKPEATAENEIILREKLMEQIESMRLSSASVRRMAKKAAKQGNYVNSAREYAKNSFNMKCALAMDIYSANKGNVSIEEAVVIACDRVTIEGTAMAVAAGSITEKAAVAICMALSIAAVIFLEELLVADFGIKTGIAILTSLNLIFMCFGGSQKLGNKMGELAATVTTAVNNTEKMIAEGFERIADFLKCRYEEEEELEFDFESEFELELEEDEEIENFIF